MTPEPVTAWQWALIIVGAILLLRWTVPWLRWVHREGLERLRRYDEAQAARQHLRRGRRYVGHGHKW
jgi:hypothetical protein